MITIEKADEEALHRVESFLKQSNLPYQDVRSNPDCFFLAYSGTECIGSGGVEMYGSDGLLRSVVIRETDRGQGYGTILCDELEEYARADGVQILYLLTTTASAFFRDRGYEEISRENTPPRIQQTTEFTDLCPSSATCMQKSL
ncbi:arsenic resistance N-acetyltransferase ArsN2 [Natrinema sp. SYSU A 869]|uniref:arsenic resistance N-acetyltransferase ArsN2 n=1 Tax=Natrinema sp. SYSU A 869 TaxID=2871694 RepID=UPI001CA3B0DE|nr:arsenic resistance N-acetyltransferase ArsN2 [Natrinema sp. SYSU A 869]